MRAREREHNPYAAPSLESDDESRPSVDDELATLGQRFVAAVLDALVILASVLVGYLLLNDYFMDSTLEFIETNRVYDMAVLFSLPYLVPLIVQWVLIAHTGQSLGKRVVGIRIVRLRGSNPGFVYGVLLRALVPALFSGFFAFLLPFLGYVLPFVDSLCVFRADRRTLRDHIAATKVIQVRK